MQDGECSFEQGFLNQSKFFPQQLYSLETENFLK